MLEEGRASFWCFLGLRVFVALGEDYEEERGSWDQIDG